MSQNPKPAEANITSVLNEKRVFRPAKEFSQRARIRSMARYQKLYNESIRSPEKFWARQAKDELIWFKPWKKVLQWKQPYAKWFVGGQLNVSYNCLDRHLDTPIANKAALIWEGEPAANQPGEERVLTYKQLHREVWSANGLVGGSKVAKGCECIRVVRPQLCLRQFKSLLKQLQSLRELAHIPVNQSQVVHG